MKCRVTELLTASSIYTTDHANLHPRTRVSFIPVDQTRSIAPCRVSNGFRAGDSIQLLTLHIAGLESEFRAITDIWRVAGQCNHAAVAIYSKML